MESVPPHRSLDVIRELIVGERKPARRVEPEVVPPLGDLIFERVTERERITERFYRPRRKVAA